MITVFRKLEHGGWKKIPASVARLPANHTFDEGGFFDSDKFTSTVHVFVTTTPGLVPEDHPSAKCCVRNDDGELYHFATLNDAKNFVDILAEAGHTVSTEDILYEETANAVKIPTAKGTIGTPEEEFLENAVGLVAANSPSATAYVTMQDGARFYFMRDADAYEFRRRMQTFGHDGMTVSYVLPDAEKQRIADEEAYSGKRFQEIMDIALRDREEMRCEQATAEALRILRNAAVKLNIPWSSASAASNAGGYKLPEETPVAADKGLRFNDGKSRVDLIPPDALYALGVLYRLGAEKYAERNWERGLSWMDTVASLNRHLMAFTMGETCDPETRLSHAVHVAWNALALLTFELRCIGTDDRPKQDAGYMQRLREHLQ